MHDYNPSALNGLRVKLAVSDFMGVAEYQEGVKTFLFSGILQSG